MLAGIAERGGRWPRVASFRCRRVPRVSLLAVGVCPHAPHVRVTRSRSMHTYGRGHCVRRQVSDNP